MLTSGRRLAALALIASVLAASPADITAAAPGTKPWTADEILKLRDLSDAQISPDGRWVAFVVSEADYDENALDTDVYLAAVPDAAPPAGGKRRGEAQRAALGASDPIPLTRSPKADLYPRWSPDGRLIAFLSARTSGKTEERPREAPEKIQQIWLIRPEGGEPWLPAAIKGSVSELAWSPDGAMLALLAREPKSADREKREKEKDDATVVDGENRRDQVWLIDTGKGAAVQVTKGAVHFTALDWSPDGRRLALAGQPTPKVPDSFRSDIYTLDLSRALTYLRQAPAAAGDGPPADVKQDAPLGEPVALVTARGPDIDPRWSPDGGTIAFLTQDGNDEWYTNAYVAIVPVAGGAPRVLTRAFDEEAMSVQFAPGGRFLLFGAFTRLSRHLFRVPAAGGEVQPLTRGGDLHRSLTLSRDGSLAALVRENGAEPPEIHIAEAGPDGALRSIRALTRLNGWAADHATLPKEPLRWKGPGGMEMEGLLVRPAGATPGRKVPLLTIVHGGPAGVFSNGFNVRRGAYPVQLFAQAGYAVLLPNPRGSGGYGEAFRKANLRDWGEKDYEDIMAGVDALIDSGLADPARLGIMGWSYGGFMTSRVITKTKRFKAASVGAGVTDTISFTGVADIPPFMRSYFGAWPWEDPALYASRTAIYNARGITTPTLIQHGEADARVPISQGWELYVALKEQGVPVEFVTYPRQGHGITEPRLIQDAMRRNLDWFARWIKTEAAP
jgi:dipeptidyl aminopeptidase/acylaminoacyl peptidase